MSPFPLYSTVTFVLPRYATGFRLAILRFSSCKSR